MKGEVENFLTVKLKVETKVRSAQRLNTRRDGSGNKIVLMKLEE